MKVQLIFEDGQQIKSDPNESQIVAISLDIQDMDPSLSSPLILSNTRLPRIFKEEELQTVANVQNSANMGKQAMIGSAITTALMTGAMAQVWSLLNGMQIFVHFPLFMIVFPPYSLLVLQSLIEIAGVNITETVTFGLVSEDKVFSTVFAAPEEDDSEI